MKRYEPATPRGVIGIAAVALTAATLGMSVLAPAEMHYGTREIGVLAATGTDGGAQRAADPALTSSIDVVGVRGVRLVPVAELRATAAKPGMQG